MPYSKPASPNNLYDLIHSFIDYPPPIQELALNFLILSDSIVIPINSGSGSFKWLY